MCSGKPSVPDRPLARRARGLPGRAGPSGRGPPGKCHQTGFGHPSTASHAGAPRAPHPDGPSSLRNLQRRQESEAPGQGASCSALQRGPAGEPDPGVREGAALGKRPLVLLLPLTLPQMTLFPSPPLSDPPAMTSVLHKASPGGSQTLPYHRHSSLHPSLHPCQVPRCWLQARPTEQGCVAPRCTASGPWLVFAFELSADRVMVTTPHSLHHQHKTNPGFSLTSPQDLPSGLPSGPR